MKFTQKVVFTAELILFSFFFLSCSEEPLSKTLEDKVESKNEVKGLPEYDWLIFRGNSRLMGKVDFDKKFYLSGKIKLLWDIRPQEENINSKSQKGFSTSPVIKDDVLFLAGSDGGIYSISCDDGKILWKKQTESSFEASVTIYENTLFCGGLNGEMIAFSESDGEIKWIYKTESRIVGAANVFRLLNHKSEPLVVQSSKDKAIQDKALVDGYVFFGSYDNNLYCVDALNGTKNWTFKSENYVNGTPAVTEKYVVFGGCDEKIRFLNPLDGKELFYIDSGSYIPGSPVLNDNKCFAALYNGQVVCVNIKNRNVLWVFSGDPENDTYLSSPAVETGKVYVSSRGNMVYCINSLNGKKIWEFSSSAPFDASPVILCNLLIVASIDGTINILDKKNGKLLSKYETGETFVGSPAVSGNRIFIPSEEGTVYSFMIH